jgi:hypothetical protein
VADRLVQDLHYAGVCDECVHRVVRLLVWENGLKITHRYLSPPDPKI